MLQNKEKRVIAIGDIHGCKDQLQCLIEHIAPTNSDQLVFLGDYIDRGFDSQGVIELCLALNQKYNCTFLKGNHEEMLLASKENKEYFSFWMRYGGVKTLESYNLPAIPDATLEIPRLHIEFIAECADYHETDDFIFSHAQPNPYKLMRQQSAEELRWNHGTSSAMHCSGKQTIFGHTPQQSGKILTLPSGWGIDTNAYRGGWLTALILPSTTTIQVNQFLETIRS